VHRTDCCSVRQVERAGSILLPLGFPRQGAVSPCLACRAHRWCLGSAAGPISSLLRRLLLYCPAAADLSQRSFLLLACSVCAAERTACFRAQRFLRSHFLAVGSALPHPARFRLSSRVKASQSNELASSIAICQIVILLIVEGSCR
jgi:hypothetical protein